MNETLKIAEGDLAMLRLSTDYGYSNTWWRVMFCDNDETFIGRLERCHWFDYKVHKIGEDVRWNIDKVQSVFIESQEFCYSDNITICDCAGLCRNK